MRTLLRGLLALIGIAAAIVAIGYFSLRRSDVDYAILAQTYANEHSQHVVLPGGVRMHYRDEGARDGPILLLIHGFSFSLQTWEPWVARLGDEYRLISIDLPGHGLTSAPGNYTPSMQRYVADVEAFAAAQGLERFTIIGNSMGGNVAWEYALAHPERVEGLVLIGASGWEETDEAQRREPAIFQLLRNPVLGPLMRDLDNTKLIRKGVEASFADPALATDEIVARVSDLSRAPGHRAILLQLTLDYRARRFATNDLLAQITAPTLILHGERDNLVPVAQGRQFAAAIPGSELVTWADEGHVPQEEHPDRSAAALRTFLEHARARQGLNVTSPN
ncbi:MAG: alpha/beta fold hydrolase [Hyphomonadaceae bacterium]